MTINQQRVPAGVTGGGQLAPDQHAPSSVHLNPAAVDGLTAQEHRQEAGRQDAAAESFDRCDSDGFLSQWASEVNADLHQAKTQIADSGGHAFFPALFNTRGNLVPAKLVNTRYGAAWMLLRGDDPRSVCAGWFNASRIPTPALRRAADAAKGFHVGQVSVPADAWLYSPPGARGLGGALSVTVQTYRTDGGFSRDVTVLDDGISRHPAVTLRDLVQARRDAADGWRGEPAQAAPVGGQGCR